MRVEPLRGLVTRNTVPFDLWEGLTLSVSEGWLPLLKKEQKYAYYAGMVDFVKKEFESNKVYPPQEDLFRCFEYTDFDNAKVIIIGKIPFYRKNQADGLAYSTRREVKPNQTSAILVKEAVEDVKIPLPNHASLINWAKQGVLLMNTIFTAPADKPASHADCGWRDFSTNLFDALVADSRPKVFILWGEYAKDLGNRVTNPNHLILTAANPSPLSAINGFYGSKPFSQANEYLIQKGYTPIDWTL